MPLLQYLALRSSLAVALPTLNDRTDESSDHHSESCLHCTVKHLRAGREVAAKETDRPYKWQEEQYNATGEETPTENAGRIYWVQKCAVHGMPKGDQRKQH
ncbi:hypothetical protein [Streptosporangium canum]|uniref:hypothetical protein n=1 Tax=Streptosporangium canum TaxID=324952 RepID=UPI0037953942